MVGVSLNIKLEKMTNEQMLLQFLLRIYTKDEFLGVNEILLCCSLL